jgi:cell division septum initiation protein DivIVA
MNTINEILVEILKLKKENKILKDIIKDLKDRNDSLKNQLDIHKKNEFKLVSQLESFKMYIKALENKILQ